jgi:hypothetical protein
MKKQQLFKLSILVAVATIALGCKEKPKPTEVVKVEKPQASVSSDTTLAELKSSGVATISLESVAKTYKENQSIQFKVNTKGKAGYLYIIYLDKSGETQLLYPNEFSPLTELSGEYLFPRDFGNMNIKATKDCKGCDEDKTTIYAILTKEPVRDIKNITKGHLLKFSGEQSSNSQNKGLDMVLGGNSSLSNTNINVGKIEFLVK